LALIYLPLHILEKSIDKNIGGALEEESKERGIILLLTSYRELENLI
jgi:hypothetical protein